MTQGFDWQGQPVRGVLFDMDGVIADTRAAHEKSWLEFAAIEGWHIEPKEFIRRTFGRGNMQILPAYYPDFADDKDFILRKSEEKEELYRRLVRAGEIELVPGLVEFLQAIAARRVRVALGSSAPLGNIAVTLEHFRIDSHFPVIVGMEHVTHAKPDPEIFLRCCEGLRLSPAECIVLEDSIHGLEAAHNAGCRAVGVTTMHPPQELAPLCEATVPDFHELMRLFSLSR